MKPIQLSPIRANGITTHAIRAEKIACGGSTADSFATTKARDISHSHNEHRAASQPPSRSQDARLSHSSRRERVLPYVPYVAVSREVDSFGQGQETQKFSM